MKRSSRRPSPRQLDHPLTGIDRIHRSLRIQSREHLQEPTIAIAQHQNVPRIPQLE
jgi:hypothetical protein